MGQREVDSRLQKLRDEGCEIYSISRLNTMAQCPYQAYLNYVEHEQGKPNAWAILGGHIHDALESCVKDGADESVVHKAIDRELENLGMLDIDFPSEAIRENWIKNMTLFADNFKTPKGNFETEQLILHQIDDKVWMQGYIDLLQHHKDGSVSIYDWKTSSKFDKNHIVEAGRQLVLYGLAKQAEGYNIKKLAWVMLKYCVVTKELKSGAVKDYVMEWRKYEPADNIISVKPYVQEYEFSQENIDECLSYIKKMVHKYQIYGDDEIAYSPCDIKKNSFFCSSLCGFGDKCKWYRDFVEQGDFGKKDDEDDLF